MTTKTLFTLASLASLVSLSLLGSTGCKDDTGLGGGDDDQPQPDAPKPTVDAPPGQTIVEIAAGDISTDTMWEARYTYILKGYVFVTAGTLTIEAGTVIKGDAGSALTITTEGKLVANGTVDKPIVFTSSRALKWDPLESTCRHASLSIL